MLKIRRPLGRLIFNMGIVIPGKTVFLIETAPRCVLHCTNKKLTAQCQVHMIGSSVDYMPTPLWCHPSGVKDYRRLTPTCTRKDIVTRWLLEDVAVILKVDFIVSLFRIAAWALAVKLFPRECHKTSIIISSGSGLMPSGSKPLPEPMSTQIHVAIRHH